MPSTAKARQSTLIVTAAEAGTALQELLAQRLKISRRAAKSLIDTRNVWVNRRRVWMAHHLLRPGDQVLAPVYADMERQNQEIKIRTLVEDANFLVVDKPAGFMSVGDGSVEELLRRQLQNPALRAIHRLDRDTTGCLLIARTPAVFDDAVSEFKKRHVRKAYNAIIVGRFPQPVSTITEELDGARAVTHLRLLSSCDDASFIALRIETGRTHQIRKHLASLRHPVLGDREYGLKFARDPRLIEVPRQMLHAVEIEMPNPVVLGETIRAHSPLPADFRRCLKLFKL